MRVAVGQGGGERRLPDVGAPPDAVLVRVVLLRAPRLHGHDRVLVRVVAECGLGVWVRAKVWAWGRAQGAGRRVQG